TLWLSQTRIAPALAAQSIPADDRFVRQGRVVQSDRLVTEVFVEFKVPLIPEVVVQQPDRLILRWVRAPQPLQDDRAGTVSQAVTPQRPPVLGQVPPAPRTDPALVAAAPAVAPASPEIAGVRAHGAVKTVQAIRLRSPITIDGRLDDEAW